MTFDQFKELTDLMIAQNKKLDSARDLGINLYEITEPNEALINSLWSLILTDYGLDWFNWFMYEKGYIQDGIGRKDLAAYDNKKSICKDLKGLYKYLVKNDYFKIPIVDAKS